MTGAQSYRPVSPAIMYQVDTVNRHHPSRFSRCTSGSWVFALFLLCRANNDAKYIAYISDRLSVCLSAHISQTPHAWTLHFLYMLGLLPYQNNASCRPLLPVSWLTCTALESQYMLLVMDVIVVICNASKLLTVGKV